MRLRNPGTIDQATEGVRQLEGHLSRARGTNPVLGAEDGFLTWIDDYARPQFGNWFAPTEDVFAELDISHNRINSAPDSTRRLNAMLSREIRDWEQRLTKIRDELAQQKIIATRPGAPIVLDTSALMEGSPVGEFNWHSLDPTLNDTAIRLVVPILVVEELDELLHDRNADRRQRARAVTRSLLELHKDKPTQPAWLPTPVNATVEVFLDGDWHHRRPNNDAEIIDQALAFGELVGVKILLAACDLRMMYRAAAVGLPSVQVPRAGGQQ